DGQQRDQESERQPGQILLHRVVSAGAKFASGGWALLPVRLSFLRQAGRARVPILLISISPLYPPGMSGRFEGGQGSIERRSLGTDQRQVFRGEQAQRVGDVEDAEDAQKVRPV